MYAYTLAKQMAAIQRRCKKIESRLSLNQPLVVDGTGTLLDIYVYQSYQLENIEIKEFRDGLTLMETSVYKGYKQDKIEMRGDRAEMSDFPLYLNTVAGGLDCRDQTIGGFSFVVKIYAVPVIEIIG